MNSPPTADPGVERLSYWLAQVCGAARSAVDRSLADVANVANLEKSTVHRFEQTGLWPRDPESLVAAYAEVAGMEDSRDLWRIALQRWREDGVRPTIGHKPRTSSPEDLESAITKLIRRRR